MKKTIFFLVLILLSMFSNSHASKEHLLVGISTGYPPFYFFTDNNKPTGICIDVINMVTQKMGITVSYTSYPWRRMLLSGEKGTVDAIMPLFSTPEREQFLIFPEVGLIDEDNSFFTTDSNQNSYTSNFAELRNHKIAVVDSYSYGPDFNRIGFSNKMAVDTTEQLISLVQSGRADIGIGNTNVINFTAKKMSVAKKLRFLSPPVTIEPLFIGFSKVKISADFVARFSKQLQKFKMTPAYQQIINSYNER